MYGVMALGGALVVLGLSKAAKASSASVEQSRKTPPPSRSENEPGPPPDVIEGYRLAEKIGEGGSAEVFRVASLRNPDAPPMALKLQREKEGVDGMADARFRIEIAASLKLQHPNLARVYDWGEDEKGRLFMVSELLQGETLRERLRREPVLGLGDVMRILLPVGSALGYLHQQKLVHRDIKPDNIFLTRQGEVKLMDLGIIKNLEGAGMTRAGVVVGTPHYLAPEQIHGESAPATDQYALAITVFEMLTGTRPFRGSQMEIIEQHLYRMPPRLGKLKPDCSVELDTALHKMLAKAPEARYRDIGQAVEALCAGLTRDFDDDGEPDTQVVILR